MTGSPADVRRLDAATGECAPSLTYELDLETRSWRQLGGHPLRQSAECPTYAAATPLPEYGVIFVADYNDPGDCRVWLYKHSPSVPDTLAPAAPSGLEVR